MLMIMLVYLFIIAVLIVFMNRSMIFMMVPGVVLPFPVRRRMAIIMFYTVPLGMLVPVAVRVRRFPIVLAAFVLTAEMLFFGLFTMPVVSVVRPGSACG